MAKRNRGIEKIYQALEPKIEEMGFELLDVIYEKEHGKLFLRLLVDKIGGINIEECALINEKLDPFIEEGLQLQSHDYFEVSSPGLDRPLEGPKEFNLYIGQLMEVRLYQKRDNRKIFTGELVCGDESTVKIIDDKTEEEIIFYLKDVAKIARTINFNK